MTCDCDCWLDKSSFIEQSGLERMDVVAMSYKFSHRQGAVPLRPLPSDSGAVSSVAFVGRERASGLAQPHPLHAILGAMKA